MNQDHKDLLSAFHAHGARYLVVGGLAVIHHAQPRFTKDVDLLVSPDPANSRAVYAALAAFGAPIQNFRAEDFQQRGSFFRFGRDPNGFDLLLDIPGVDFESAWDRRVEVIIDRATGQKANFISAPDLLASKLATGRPQDLADAEAIRAALASQRPKP